MVCRQRALNGVMLKLGAAEPNKLCTASICSADSLDHSRSVSECHPARPEWSPYKTMIQIKRQALLHRPVEKTPCHQKTLIIVSRDGGPVV